MNRPKSEKVRNRMIHEYTSDPTELAEALGQAHRFVPTLKAFLDGAAGRLEARFPDLRRL